MRSKREYAKFIVPTNSACQIVYAAQLSGLDAALGPEANQLSIRDQNGNEAPLILGNVTQVFLELKNDLVMGDLYKLMNDATNAWSRIQSP